MEKLAKGKACSDPVINVFKNVFSLFGGGSFFSFVPNSDACL